MPLNAIVYASQAVPVLTPDHLSALVQEAAAFNGEHGITGVLLYDGSRFLQYIEGPDVDLRAAYARVCKATSHHEMMELARGQIDARRFPNWAIGLECTGT
ncbi:BLUF domain-containing protein [Stenotrophomonas sp. ZAC14D2_NAIMI4_7]|uniref:BLUF domain-containing protein n=1 Tax=Stenotrophomonas sp. ZAC14D2_NAIMI4_7 TaxID=2072405 RepID=UPI001F46BCF0|nr:BLUF domain-containing protein [Stenotrophomonas sp. ZAC14D2_NAIMI4_7]